MFSLRGLGLVWFLGSCNLAVALGFQYVCFQVVHLGINQIKHEVDIVEMEAEDFDVLDAHQVKVGGRVDRALRCLEAVIWVVAVVFVLIFVSTIFLGILFGFGFLVVLSGVFGVESWMRFG